MKALVLKEQQFVMNAKGKPVAVLLDLKTYDRLREAEEDLAEIRAYDAARPKVAAELEANFEFLFKQLNVQDTKSFVASIVKPVDVTIGLRASQAVLDGEGDD